MVLELSIRTSASPRQQRSHWGLRVTQDAYFSLLTHTKQLLLVTFCDITAGNGYSLRTHKRTNGQTDGQTDGQTEVEVDSYLDLQTLSIQVVPRLCRLWVILGIWD